MLQTQTRGVPGDGEEKKKKRYRLQGQNILSSTEAGPQDPRQSGSRVSASSGLTLQRRPALTCYIPELQPHQGLAVPVDNFEREIHPDGGPVVLGEELVHIPLNNTGFTHAQLSDHQHLEQMLPALRHAGARSFPAGHPLPCRGAERCGARRGERAAGTAALPPLNFPSWQLFLQLSPGDPPLGRATLGGEASGGRRSGTEGGREKGNPATT